MIQKNILNVMFGIEMLVVMSFATWATGGMRNDGKTFGMTAGTLVVRMGETDIQLKPITPKTGITRYEVVEE